MKVVITGGTGMLARKLMARLLDGAELAGPDGTLRAVDEIVLFDNVEPPAPLPDDARIALVVDDIRDGAAVARAIDGATDAVFHLASVVSGGAEVDFDLGYGVNMGGMSNVLEACRTGSRVPRIVFTSSLAVYGGEAVIDDRTPLTPQTSYGVHKASGELLINDYTRKGFVDGRSVRLPTIVVRPGKPNRAASGFASSLLREPLQGERVACPVTPATRMLCLSPRNAIEAFIALHNLDGDALGHNRAVLLNGVSPTMAEAADALARRAGDAVAARIDWTPDPLIQKIVDTWPYEANGRRAVELGLPVDASIDAIIEAFIDDDLGGRIAA